MSLFALIDTIRRRPAMFVDDGGLAALDAFLRGYHFARVGAGLADAADRHFVEDFYPWLQRRHGANPAATWVEPVRQQAERDGRSPFDLFFELVDAFRRDGDAAR